MTTHIQRPAKLSAAAVAFLLLTRLVTVAAFGSVHKKCIGRQIDAVNPQQQLPKSLSSSSDESGRRAFLSKASQSIALASSLLVPSSVGAVASLDQAAPSAPQLNDDDPSMFPLIAQKVAFDVRISRQDGTFYVRDDLPDAP